MERQTAPLAGGIFLVGSRLGFIRVRSPQPSGKGGGQVDLAMTGGQCWPVAGLDNRGEGVHAGFFVQCLGSRDAADAGCALGLIDKAAAHCADKKIDPAALLTARLYPNMYMFQKQVQVACDWARNTAGRLAGVDVPKMADDEKSFDDLKGRIVRSVEFLNSVDAATVEAGADRDVRWAAGPNTREMNGADFVLHQALPQFFFHVTTAYDILRHNGVELAKRDFMGQVPRMRTVSAAPAA
jgi:uncharacterized protein